MPYATKPAAPPLPDSNLAYCKRLAEYVFPMLDTVILPPQQTLRAELTYLLVLTDPEAAIVFASVATVTSAIRTRPDVQSRLAVITQYTASTWLLERELEACNYWPKPPDETAQARRFYEPGVDGRPDVYRAARCRSAKGICLSGGGIRSATFNLGVLQGLARHGQIQKFDYLSSVSGGGYIHQFLASWIHRAGSTSAVEAKLNSVPNIPEESRPGSRPTVQPEPLRWLRRYSNYLAPHRGLFSLDSWTIVATWVRNTGLNLTILFASLFFLFLMPNLVGFHFALSGHRWFFNSLLVGMAILCPIAAGILTAWLSDMTPPGSAPLAIKFVCVVMFAAAAMTSPSLYRAAVPGHSIKSDESQKIFAQVQEPAHFHYDGLFRRDQGSTEQLKVSVDSREEQPRSRLSTHWPDRPPAFWRQPEASSFYGQLLIFAILCSYWFFLVFAANDSTLQRAHSTTPLAPSRTLADSVLRLLKTLLLTFSRPLIVLLGFLGACFALQGIQWLFYAACFSVPLQYIPALGVVLLPTLLFGLPFLLMEIGLGLLGAGAPASQREWLARLRAFSLLLGGAWLAYTSFSLIGPHLFAALAHSVGASYSLWGGWLLTTVGGVLAAKSERTGGDSSAGGDSTSALVMQAFAKAAPVVFITGLLVLVATLVRWSLQVPAGSPVSENQRFLLLTFVSGLIACLFGRRVDINEFSMHAFYRDRLARCYAGASEPHREPNLFTGFTEKDSELSLRELLPSKYNRAKDDQGNPLQGTYDGPFPILCTSINLTFGEDLAYQERKAASFAMTPLYTGYSVGWTAGKDPHTQFNGFVDTASYVYTEKGSLSLATACAISGAAASPSMGYHSSPAVAFLLTVFNVRLGWWLRNPRKRKIMRTSPYIAPGSEPTNVPQPPQNSGVGARAKAWYDRHFPLKAGLLPSSPKFGLVRLLMELTGRSDDTTSYVLLTDGGHFDNMGLYELIRRRCRDIVVCDSESDAHLQFEGIGMAIRKARLDFGVEITLDRLTPLTPEEMHPRPETASVPKEEKARQVAKGAAAKVEEEVTDSARRSPEVAADSSVQAALNVTAHVSSLDASNLQGTIRREPSANHQPGLYSFEEFPGNSVHCVHGTIRYPEDTSESDFGHILYIKASLTGDEPPDVLNYRRQHAHFPHDTTMNQFFTESQFESYRRLGEHIVLSDPTAIGWLAHYIAKDSKEAQNATGQ